MDSSQCCGWQTARIGSNILPDHSIDRNDGSCIQKAGTKLARANDLCLLGISCWKPIIIIIYFYYDKIFKNYPGPSAKIIDLLNT